MIDGVLVIDSTTCELVKTIALPYGVAGIIVSADGSRLYVAGGFLHAIKCIDLNTLTLLPDIPTGAIGPGQIADVGDGSLYITDGGGNGIIYQIDRLTGAILSQFSPFSRNGYSGIVLAASPDRKTLYVVEGNFSPSRVARYGLNAGSIPSLLQVSEVAGPQSSITQFAVSPDGQRLAFTIRSYSGGIEATVLRSAHDLNVALGSFPTPNISDNIVFSRDGSLAIQSYAGLRRLDVFEVATRRLVKTIALSVESSNSGGGTGPNLVVDGSNSLLFLAGSYTLSPPILSRGLLLHRGAC